jgi:hypothetical protein
MKLVPWKISMWKTSSIASDSSSTKRYLLDLNLKSRDMVMNNKSLSMRIIPLHSCEKAIRKQIRFLLKKPNKK